MSGINKAIIVGRLGTDQKFDKLALAARWQV